MNASAWSLLNQFRSIAVCRLDAAGVITAATDAATQMLNEKPEGKDFCTLWIEHTEICEGKLRRTLRTTSTGSCQTYQIEFLHPGVESLALLYLIPHGAKVRTLEAQLARMEELVMKLADHHHPEHDAPTVTVNTGDEMNAGRDAWQGDRSQVNVSVVLSAVMLLAGIVGLAIFLAIRSMQ